jgi:MFS family permease
VRLYAGVYLGVAISGVLVSAIIYWTPTYLERRYGWSVASAGVAFGTAVLIASISASLIAPQIAEWLRRRGYHGGTTWVLIIAVCLGALMTVAAALQPTARGFIICVGFSKLFLTAANSVALTSFQIIAPGEMRATLVALYMMTFSVVGGILGGAGIAWINQLFFSAGAMLEKPLITLSIGIAAIALLLLFWGQASFNDLMRSIHARNARPTQPNQMDLS